MLKYLDFINESNSEIIFELDNKSEFINELVNELSFAIKKRIHKYIRPTKISGKVNPIDLIININNGDKIHLKYDNNEIFIKINNDVIYHVDNFEKDKVLDKLISLYKKELVKDGYKISNTDI